MEESVIKEIDLLINKYDLNCSRDNFSDYIDWETVVMRDDLSEAFMEEFEHKINKDNWLYLSGRQAISEDFILKHKDKLSWSSISVNEKIDLSTDFIIKFKDKLDIFEMIQCGRISNEWAEHHSLIGYIESEYINGDQIRTIFMSKKKCDELLIPEKKDLFMKTIKDIFVEMASFDEDLGIFRMCKCTYMNNKVFNKIKELFQDGEYCFDKNRWGKYSMLTGYIKVDDDFDGIVVEGW